MTSDAQSEVFTPELSAYIEEWKDKPGNLIMVLHRVQKEYGYLPRQVLLELSKRIETPVSRIYGVITFYHLFRLIKPGKHKISVCMGTACYLKGGQDIMNELENILGIGVNSTTDDGKFSLEAVRCIGCCGLSPVISVDGEVHGKVTTELLPEIIAKYQE